MRHSITIIFLWTTLLSFSQTWDTLVVMDEVHISKSKIKQKEGFKVDKLITGTTIENASKDLANLISSQTPLYINTQGAGNTAVIKIRGTDPSHTQVSWNGLNINSTSKGYTDFSQIPSFLIDEASVSYGTESLFETSGSLGGSIKLNTRLNWKSKSEHTFFSEYGSHNTQTYGLKTYNNFSRFLSKSKIYYRSSDNNFRYLNKVKSINHEYERREHSEFSSLGIMQEFGYKINDFNYFSLHTWYQQNKKNLPDIIVNEPGYQFQDKEDKSLRNILNYRTYTEKSNFSASLGYIYEESGYNRRFRGSSSYSTLNDSQVGFLKLNYSINLYDNLTFAANITNKIENINSYEKEEPKNNDFVKILSNKFRNTQTAAISVNYKHSDKLIINAIFKEELVKNKLFIIPSVGTQYLLNKYLSFTLNAGKTNHSPTMNDLYFRPGGNPDLKSENGEVYEIGNLFTFKNKHFSINTNTNLFYTKIKNWIIWEPSNVYNFWEAKNLYKVVSQGLENTTNLKFIINKVENKLSAKYSYTQTLNKSDYNESYNSYNKQLIYVPRHNTNLSYKLKYKKINFEWQTQFTDKRYTSTDNSYYTDPFSVSNASVSFSFKLKKIKYDINFKVNNIFDSYYEIVQYYPMPLRQYFVSLQIKI